MTKAFSLSSSFFCTGPVPAVLQGSAGVPGELRPLCNVTTPTEQLPPVRPLRSVPSVSSQPPSTHLTLPPSPLPPKPRPLAATGGVEKGMSLQTRWQFLTNHRDTCRVNLPPEMFALKIITKHYSDYWQLRQLLYRPDGADWQLASLLHRSQTSLIVKGYW